MSQPDPAASVGGDALFTVDLSENAGPETGGQKFGRIVGGLVLMILGAVLALACGAGYVVAWFADATETWWWADLLGDGLLFIGALFLGVAILGFEIMRRGRKARAATDYFEALAKVPGMEEADDTYDPGPVPPAGAATPPPSKPIL